MGALVCTQDATRTPLAAKSVDSSTERPAAKGEARRPTGRGGLGMRGGGET
jgi:hypothetical protein